MGGMSEKLIFSNLLTGFLQRENLKLYFDEFTHQFENPHNYQNVQNKILFHLCPKSSAHAMTRPRKIEKTENLVSSTFLKTNFS